VVDRQRGQGGPERQGRLDRHQPVVRAFEFEEPFIKRQQRPADLPRRWVSGHAENASAPEQPPLAVDRPGGAAGHVEEPADLDPQAPEQSVDPVELQPGAVGERRAEVRRADRREAQDPARPLGVGEHLAGVEPPHAVPDHVDAFARERPLALFGQGARPTPDPCEGGHPGDEDPVPGRPEEPRDAAEVGGEREAADADPAEPE
jgi:hypothetical protein